MPSQRQDNLDALALDADFDVIVVGGGINGIGVYRELALQGLRVLLVERNDFCSGCSAAPSRMIHGGLRYLENGEFDLVRESLTERDALMKTAPHFVRPLPTTIPITTLFSGTWNAAATFLGKSDRPARRGALPIKLGLTLYDWVTRKRRILPKHKFRTASSTRKIWPELTDKLRFSATYHDAWISHPERLGVELILDVAHDHPISVALNYVELTPAPTGYQITDKLSGQAFSVTTKSLVNATGAWLDEAISALSQGKATEKPLVSGTKGSHLILDNHDLYNALAGHMVYYENVDRRVCIVFPYLGKVLAGSTDIRVNSVSQVRCEPDEQDYILGSLSRVFPNIAITPDQIVFSYSGIRPLPNSDHDFTGRISRGHFVARIEGKIPQFCMVGGKWTTFRAFAEQTADLVLADLKRERKVSTTSRAIGGGNGFPDSVGVLTTDLMMSHSVSHERAQHFATHYGTRAHEVLKYCATKDDDQALSATCLFSTGEIAYLMEHEYVGSVSDIVLRRTDLAITGQVSTELIDGICDIMANSNNWSVAQIQVQKQNLIDDLQNFHGVSLDMLKSRNSDKE